MLEIGKHHGIPPIFPIAVITSQDTRFSDGSCPRRDFFPSHLNNRKIFYRLSENSGIELISTLTDLTKKVFPAGST